MSLIIAGVSSGVGKTTITMSLLAALRQRHQTVQSFKVGPDYIDPMFHQDITGCKCRNLDPVLTSEAYVQQCFQQHSQAADYALIEGVMGLFDGAAGAEDFASTAHIARLLNLPIVLVLDCSRLSRSAAAIAHGYRTFDPRLQLAGVILNRVGSDRHLELLTEALNSIDLPILGALRRQDGITIPDRHLGLVPTAELENFRDVSKQLAHIGATCFDWGKLLPLLASDPNIKVEQPQVSASFADPKVRLAIAQDAAFNFYYADNLELLEYFGAELVSWSPLQDHALPDNIHGLYFGGGFPEVFAHELAANVSMKSALRSIIQSGIPTYAECGGLMYLCEQIVDFDERSHPMVGVLPTTAVMGKRLTLGYRRAIALQNSPMITQGAHIKGHEFHRSTLATESTQPLLQLQGYAATSRPQPEGWQLHCVHASYLHLHFGANRQIPARFLQQCRQFAIV